MARYADVSEVRSAFVLELLETAGALSHRHSLNIGEDGVQVCLCLCLFFFSNIQQLYTKFGIN